MASRLDLLKSLVRTATRASAARVQDLGAVKQARLAVRELRGRRATVTEAALSSALAAAPELRGVTVRIGHDRVTVDAGYLDGEHLALAIIPETARFAPRGAKEVVFRVEPPERVGESRVGELVGCVGAAIAKALFGPLMREGKGGPEVGLVEREGERLRCDLRTVPSVRNLLEGNPLGVAVDMMAIESFAFEDRALRIKVALPRLGGGGR